MDMERSARLPGTPFSMFYRFVNRQGERKIGVRATGLLLLGVLAILFTGLIAFSVFIVVCCSSAKHTDILYIIPLVIFFFSILLLFQLLYMFSPRFDLKRGYYMPNGLPARTPEQLARIGAIRFDDIGGIVIYRDSNGRCTLDFLLKGGCRKAFMFGNEKLMRSNAAAVCDFLEIPLQDELKS